MSKWVIWIVLYNENSNVTISFEFAKLMTVWSPHVVSHPAHCTTILTPETFDKGGVALRLKATYGIEHKLD